MNFARAVTRRLDPWAALLLGVFLALGVVILLATPGPWHKVVRAALPVRIGPSPPNDVAVFALAGNRGACTGIVWLHVDPEATSLTAVVVPGQVTGFTPGAGPAPIADIVDSAGPGAGASALSDALGVHMDAWLTLDREAVQRAVEPMFPLETVRAARDRYGIARAAWRGHGSRSRAWVQQYETLREALPRTPFEKLGVVAFSNYVLGFGFVRSDLTLRGAASLADALRGADASHVTALAAPVLVERCRTGSVWRVDQEKLAPVLQALALGEHPYDPGVQMTTRGRAARVLVVAPMARGAARAYAAEVRRSLLESAGAPVGVGLVSGVSGRLAFNVESELDARPALAVLVAPPPSEDDPHATAALRKVYLMLRRRRQETVIGGRLPAPVLGAMPSPTSGFQAVLTGAGLPVSWLATPPSGTSATSPAAARRAARGNVETLVRACWPGTLAPAGAATRLSFAFVVARHTGVGVVAASDGVRATLLLSLRRWGFPAGALEASTTSWQPQAPSRRTTVYCLPGERKAAAVLAADLGLRPAAVVVDASAPRPLVVVAAD